MSKSKSRIGVIKTNTTYIVHTLSDDPVERTASTRRLVSPRGTFNRYRRRPFETTPIEFVRRARDRNGANEFSMSSPRPSGIPYITDTELAQIRSGRSNRPDDGRRFASGVRARSASCAARAPLDASE